jgi:RNA polymerase sigma-70 factor (ECF subfamily)
LDHNLSDKEIIQGLRSGRDEAVLNLYRRYRAEFISWTFGRYGIARDSAADCFQDAVIALYNNVMVGKLDRLDSSLKTYLFSIGKNFAMKKLKMQRREILLSEEMEHVTNSGNMNPETLYVGNEKVNTIAGLVDGIKEPCRSILRYFYYRGYSMEAIAETMHYKNADTVKAQKVRCIKVLKQKVRGDIFDI